MPEQKKCIICYAAKDDLMGGRCYSCAKTKYAADNHLKYGDATDFVFEPDEIIQPPKPKEKPQLNKCEFCDNPVSRAGAYTCGDPECKRQHNNKVIRQRWQRCRASIVRKCKHCGKEFTPTNYRQAFCTNECRDLSRKQTETKYRRKVRERKVKTTNPYHAFTEEDKQRVIAMRNQRISVTQIALALGCGRSTVNKYVKLWGIKYNQEAV